MKPKITLSLNVGKEGTQEGIGQGLPARHSKHSPASPYPCHDDRETMSHKRHRRGADYRTS